VAQVVEFLPSKHETMDPILRTSGKKITTTLKKPIHNLYLKIHMKIQGFGLDKVKGVTIPNFKTY
jgi:hypothetical protein